MIETVHKTLTAIHSGADIKEVKSVIAAHADKIKEIRKTTQRPKFTASTVTPRQRYTPTVRSVSRGSVRYNPSATFSLNQLEVTVAPRTKARGQLLSQTTSRPVRLRTKISAIPQRGVQVLEGNSLFEEAERSRVQPTRPKNFQPSQLIGITMDKYSALDRDTVEKVFLPVDVVHEGFIPIVGNSADRQVDI